RTIAVTCTVAALVAFVLLAAPAPAAAQGHGHGHGHDKGDKATLDLKPNLCPSPVAGQPLEQPKVIQADRYGVLQTRFVVDAVQYACVPQWDTDHWTTAPMRLRTYGTPRNEDPANLEWALPGPTLRARKTYLADNTRPPGPDNPVVERGSRISLTLVNQLPNTTYPYDECLPKTVTQTAASNTCPNPPCTFVEQAPECFHGSEVTNLHYHGTHVSPQPHQDFVLLNLYSAEQTYPAPPPHDEYNQVGTYQYSIDPFPWNQAPGTHWYHPHKHGSTALQVANGMSGALVIQGPFDDWLYSLYGVDDSSLPSIERFEKIVIVQQLQEDLNFYDPAAAAVPQPTVNGQASPVIEMYPGEVQRWRFIGATVHAAGAMNVGFPEQMVVRQIAQDGVQFASENYARQPFVKKVQRTIAKARGSKEVVASLDEVSFGNYVISPGNRADFLVKAPTATGDYTLTFQLVHQNLADNVNKPFASRNALPSATDDGDDSESDSTDSDTTAAAAA
ncbi:MAG TPA: multicopper oxidase domain-containing protein, partial [Thermoanaerobaculia bacterium]|nr:multicopper oxidase domain-containing protein [Thermoanaerobaculia bacterium]